MEEPRCPHAPRYPHITVRLTDTDGNCFAILGKLKFALWEGGVSEKEIGDFFHEATGGDYDHLLQTVMRWVEVE